MEASKTFELSHSEYKKMFNINNIVNSLSKFVDKEKKYTVYWAENKKLGSNSKGAQDKKAVNYYMLTEEYVTLLETFGEPDLNPDYDNYNYIEFHIRMRCADCCAFGHRNKKSKKCTQNNCMSDTTTDRDTVSITYSEADSESKRRITTDSESTSENKLCGQLTKKGTPCKNVLGKCIHHRKS